MKSEPNHECKVCGKAYYADESSDPSWVIVACSQKCFKEWIRIIDERDNPKPVEEQNETQDAKPVVKKSKE